MIRAVLLVVLLAVAIPVAIVEYRIMRKPESERTERERRFIGRRRKFGLGYQKYSLNILPWVSVALGAVLILLGVLFWAEDPGVGLFLTIFGAVSAVGMFLFWVWARGHRGAAWREHQMEEYHKADLEGRPRWFVSPKAGFVTGGVAIAAGVLFGGYLLLADPTDSIRTYLVCGSLILIGVLCLIGARVQGHRPR